MNDVLLARAKWRDHKDGPEDAIVSEMMKKLPMEKICTIARCFQEEFMESPNSRKVGNLVFLKKLDAAQTKGIRMGTGQSI